MTKQVLPVPNPILSYWIRDGECSLDKELSKGDIPKECDVLIIGSGMAGVMTAYHLLKDNPKPPNTVILEARNLCSGATGRNGGHSKVKTATLAKICETLGPAAADEMKAYNNGVIDGLKKVVDEEGLDCEFELRRSFDVFTDEEEAVRLKKVYDDSVRAEHTWTKGNSFIDKRYAEQTTSIIGAKAAFCVPAASFWPYKFVTQIVSIMLQRHHGHFEVHTQTAVESVTQSNGVSIIRTAKGTIRSKKVVFATNAWTTGLLPQFKGTIIPYKGCATHLVPAKPVHPHLTNTYNIAFAGLGTDYLNPRPDGSIVVGGANWLFRENRPLWNPNWDDSVRLPPDVEAYWEGYMQRNFLGWEGSGSYVDTVWVGIQASTPDEWPHVGRVPGRANQWMLAGFNGGGMALILTISKAVAKIVREDVEFETAAAEFGVPLRFAASLERFAGHDGEGEDALSKRLEEEK
jgi:glycine/D-amino acid oxidase-like deaminating enzyme